jgi:hypothetical protein
LSKYKKLKTIKEFTIFCHEKIPFLHKFIFLRFVFKFQNQNIVYICSTLRRKCNEIVENCKIHILNLDSVYLLQAACSPLFCRILAGNPHQNPLLYLKGINQQDLRSILDFMYRGEVYVPQVSCCLKIASTVDIFWNFMQNLNEVFNRLKNLRALHKDYDQQNIL